MTTRTNRAGRGRPLGRRLSAMAAIGVAVAMLTGAAPASIAGAAAPTASVAAGASLDPALVAQLEAALDAGFAASGMPGVTVGLWIPGQGEWVASRGVSDLGTATPMDRANQSKIGSITKTLVGTTALQLIGDGELGLTLDDTIDQWYPNFPDATQISLRMLMNMSSGIAEPGQDQIDRICADPYSTITPDEMIAIGASLPRAHAPGEGFTYSGYNTFLLGRILEKATGSDLGTLIDQRLLGPLGMTRSRFAPDGQLTAPLNRGYSGFCPNLPDPADTTDWYNHESWAAGAMLSTIDDLHTWGVALGEGFGLTPAMQAARIDDDLPMPGFPGYSYGLAINIHRDPATGCLLDLNHNGAEPGYGASVGYYSTTGSVFALVGNGDGGTGTAFAEVGLALAPVVSPIVNTTCASPVPPPTSAPAPAAPAAGVTPVVATPAFTG